MWSSSKCLAYSRIKTVSTSDTLVNVMRTMADLMGKANKNMNVQSVEQALTIFQTEMERGNIMAEQIEDVMNMGEEDIDDEAADKLIADVEINNIKGKVGPQPQEATNELDDFEARINAIK
jgi:division protein CdvB (Snf7/Vps24/ESCRT-III family)